MQNSGEFRQGGRLVFAGAVGLTTGMSAVMYYSLGAFIPFLEAEFGWSRGDISLAFSFLTLAIFLSSIPAGRLCDRFGAARVGTLSLLAYAFGLVGVVLTASSIEVFWLAYFMVAILGAGTTPVIMVRPLAVVFSRRRGLALGLALTGAGLAGFWAPQVVTAVAEAAGWRVAYFVLAGIGLLGAPIVWYGFRDARTADTRNVEAATLPGLDVSEARKTPHFWLLTTLTFVMAISTAGIVVHLVPLLRDTGLSPMKAAGIASMLGLSTVGGRLVIGMFLDRFSAPIVLMGVFGLASIGLVMLLSGTQFSVIAILLLGFAAGAEIDLLAYLSARYFGPRNFGSIYGWMYSVFAIGYGLGPYLVGRLYDGFGSYFMPLFVCLCLTLLTAVMAFTLRFFALPELEGKG